MSTRKPSAAVPLALAAVLAAGVAAGRADVILYPTEAAFTAATGVGDVINPPFSALTLGPIVAGPLTITRGPGVTGMGVGNVLDTPFFSDLVVDGASFSNFNFDVQAPTRAFGFSVGSNHNTAFFADGTSEFTVSLYDAPGSPLLERFTITALSNPLGGVGSARVTFVGFEATAPFGRIEVEETRGGPHNVIGPGILAIGDREYFGRFFVAGGVPEPSSALLFGPAALLLAGAYRRARRGVREPR